MEKKILSALVGARHNYEQLEPYLSDDDFSEQGRLLYSEIRNFYHLDNKAAEVDTDLLKQRIETSYPKHYEQFNTVLDQLKDVSVPNLFHDLLHFKKKQTALKLGYALIGEDQKQINSYFEEYAKYKNAAEDIFQDNDALIATPVEELITHVSPENLIPVYPKELNNKLDGGVPPETHILIFALTEVGKSLFAINMAAGFLKAGKRVLYIENEDPTIMTQLRFVSRLSHMLRADILKDPAKAQKIALDRGYQNLIIAPQSPGSIGSIRRLVDKYAPDVLFINQLHNLQTKSLTKVEKNEYLATEVRNIVKAYGLVGVSITQAADSARNKLVLDDGDVYFSNVAIQSQIDLMIGLGTNEELTIQNRRMVSLPKNKISGDHEPFAVIVDPYMSKVTSI